MSIGEVLAAARLDVGMTVSDVSDRTRITRTIITAIEGDDYAGCGGDFYARGHIRSIAKAVGADPEPLIREYDGARQERPRRPPIWKLALAAGLVAAIGLTGYLLANRTHSVPPAAGSARATPSPTAARSGHPASSAPAAAAAVPLRILRPVSAAAFGFAGRPGDHGELARLAIDRNPATAWNTDWYATARFGNLYPGTGLLVDMGRPVTIKAVRITLGRASGASLQLRVGSAPTSASLQAVAHTSDAGGVVHLRMTRPANGRYVLVWFTQLPPDPSGTFRESVYGVQLRGRT